MLLQLLVNGLVVGGAYALAALGLNLVFGILDVVNFAHGVLYTLGAYFALSAVTRLGLDFFPSLLLSMSAVAVVAAILEKLVFKRVRFHGHLPAIIASMGLSMLAFDAIRIIWSAEPKHLSAPYTDITIHMGGVVFNLQRLLVVIVGSVLMGVLYWVVRNTRLGIQMRAVSQDFVASRLCGVNLDWISTATFAIAGAITAAAGVLITPLYSISPMVGDPVTIKSWAVVILGGVGSMPGVIIAGIMMGLVEAITAGYIAPGFESLVAFVILILTLLFKPKGLLRGR